MTAARISFFSEFHSKIGKNKEMILGNFQIDKIELRLRISKFSSFIHYVLGLFELNTKIEGITKIWLVNDFNHVTNKLFIFCKKKILSKSNHFLKLIFAP